MSDKKSKRKNTDPYNLGDIHDFLYEKFAVTSATECTGLIPTDPLSEAERESYKEIYDIN